jgi:glycosyltransferase involved in cell wall biosynthesis
MITGVLPARPEAPVGGVEAVLSCLVGALVRARPDMDLHLVLAPAAENAVDASKAIFPCTIHRVKGWTSAISMLPGFRPSRGIVEVLAEIRPDVVHVQAAATFVDGRRYPSILTIHGVRERDALFRDVPLRRLRSWMFKCMEWPARRRYRHIISLTGYMGCYLAGRVTGRLHFIPNPVDGRFFESSRRESGPNVVFVGRVTPLKNLHGIIEAVGRLAADGVDCRLRVIGPRDEPRYNAQLDAIIHRMNIGGRVEFLGSLDRPAMIKEMQTARCMVLASFQENAPMAVAEAGAMGIPQVVAPAGGVAEMVMAGYSGQLVDAASPESIAEGLRPFVAGADLADAFGQRARNLAQVYHPDRVAQRTLEVYEAVVRETAGGRP